jgi:hypothetical protein
VQLDVDVSIGPGGVGAAAGGSVLGQQLPTVGATVPVP